VTSVRRRVTRAIGLLSILAFGVAGFGRVRVASAQTTDRAAAAELFREGRRALEDKDYGAACPKFEESLRYDRRVGTLLSLAECEEARGKLAVARTRFQEAEDLAREQGDSRADFAKERFDAVDARVPRLVVRLSPDAPADTSIERDGVAIGAASLDVPLPVEVGSHSLVASAPHHSARTFEVALAEGDHREVSVEPGDPLPIEAAPHLEALEKDVPAAAPRSAFERRPLRIAALGAGALALVGIGVGSYFGIKAIHEQSGAPGICGGVGDDECDRQGTTVREDAIHAGNISTVAFVAAGVLGATGVVLWVISPSKNQAARVGFVPSVSGQTASVHAFGRF
jgi:tetratricopeptide (TPR) repeat protein